MCLYRLLVSLFMGWLKVRMMDKGCAGSQLVVLFNDTIRKVD